MKRKLAFGLGALGFVATALITFRVLRGPTGELSIAVPEFRSLDPARWCNGAPQSMTASRGEVVFLEGWSPT